MLERKLTRTGNSLCVVIPRLVLDMLGWEEGTEVTLELADKGLRISKKKREVEDLFGDPGTD